MSGINTVAVMKDPAVLAAFYDITVQKEAEQRQAHSEVISSGVFELSPDFITLTRLDTGEYIRVDDSFKKTFGFSEQEVVGKRSTDIGIWIDFGQRDEIVREISEKGFVSGFEDQCRAKSGAIMNVSLSSMILDVGNEKLLCMIGRDIADRLSIVLVNCSPRLEDPHGRSHPLKLSRTIPVL